MTTNNTTGNYNAYGSYIQLSTLDEKEKPVDGEVKLFLGTLPYRKFLCTKRDTIIVSISLVLAACLIIATLAVGIPKIRENEKQYYDTSFAASPSNLSSFDKAAVIVDGEQCAEIGKDVLEKDGTAVDAAIATLFCNGVVTPQSMGLGGGFFMLVYINETKKSEIIDAREAAPISATEDMFHGNKTLTLTGGLAVAVPGELRGYWLAHRKYGKADWGDLIQPSIDICLKGFKVSAHMASKLEALKDKIMHIPAMRQEFVNNETGTVFKEGEIMKRPLLAKTLVNIADKGADVLYTGEMSEQFAQDIQDCGGIITKLDLQEYQPEFREPIKVPLQADGATKTLLTMPPPGSGLVISLILQLIQKYNITEETMNNVDTAALTYHHLVEAFKFGFSYRTRITDPAFVDLTQMIKDLSDAAYVEKIFRRISDEGTFSPEYYNPVESADVDYGTAQVSVLAPNGDAVSATSTVNTYFGSLCMSPSTGIILNNEMDGFSSPNISNYFSEMPSSRNIIEPRKRPVSSMSPSILVDENGEVEMVVGAMGGTRIITAIAQNIMRILWLNQDVKVATDAPRLHHQLIPNYLQYEDGFPRVYLDRLHQKYGHKIQEDQEPSSILTILRKEGEVTANIDYRKGGSVAGF